MALFIETLRQIFPTLVHIHEAGYHMKVIMKRDYWNKPYHFTPDTMEFSPESWTRKLGEWLEVTRSTRDYAWR